MANKIDQKLYDRIVELRNKHGLTHDVIAARVGVSSRTVRVYLRAALTATVPYQPTVKVEDLSSTPPK